MVFPIISLRNLFSMTIVIAILMVILWYLYSQNKIFTRKLIIKKRRYFYYKNQIKVIKNISKDINEKFERLSQILREFFYEYYQLKYSLTYLEVSNKFQQQKLPELAKFCKQISDLKYSGTEVNEKNINGLINTFENILDSKLP